MQDSMYSEISACETEKAVISKVTLGEIAKYLISWLDYG